MISYQKEEKEVGLRRQLSKKAVDLAVQGRWEEAETVNREIIEKFPTDVEAYNRLGRTLVELGDFVKAKEAYAKALELAPDNAIAKKNLTRLANLPGSTAEASTQPTIKTQRIAPELFVTEIGKTGVAKLLNMASNEVLTKLGIGAQVRLNVEGQRLIVEDELGEYLGEVEPKHAARLITLVNGGNRYDAAILNVRPDEVELIIKEVYQDPSQVGHLSFPVKKGIAASRSHARESLPRRSITLGEGGLEETEGSAEEPGHPRDEEESELEGFTFVDETMENSSGGENR